MLLQLRICRFILLSCYSNFDNIKTSSGGIITSHGETSLIVQAKKERRRPLEYICIYNSLTERRKMHHMVDESTTYAFGTSDV